MRGLVALERHPGAVAVMGGATLGAALLGVLIASAPVLAAVALIALGLGISVARNGAVGAVVPAFAALPWMVILEGRIPHAMGTATAALAVGSLLFYVAPLCYRSALLPVASAVFVSVVLVHSVYVVDGEQAIQAAKYSVFAAMVLAVCTDRARELLPPLKKPVLASCLLAMVFHLGVIAAGAGKVSTYYEAGERLGFAADGPHALALMSMIIAAVGLTAERMRTQIVFFALGAIPVVLTGVRSALLGLAVILVIYVIQSPSKRRALIVLAAVTTAAVAVGGWEVLTTRLSTHPDEFSSITTAGSGRGAIWEIAFNAWGAAGPVAWIFGTGLRSILAFQLTSLGVELVGHSDMVEVLVQLGVVGFAAWLALWLGLLQARLRTLVLLPILAFGLVNGTLEYVAPLTVGIFLAAVCVDVRRAELA